MSAFDILLHVLEFVGWAVVFILGCIFLVALAYFLGRAWRYGTLQGQRKYDEFIQHKNSCSDKPNQ